MAYFKAHDPREFYTGEAHLADATHAGRFHRSELRLHEKDRGVVARVRLHSGRTIVSMRRNCDDSKTPVRCRPRLTFGIATSGTSAILKPGLSAIYAAKNRR